jgi:hypothetical protein
MELLELEEFCTVFLTVRTNLYVQWPNLVLFNELAALEAVEKQDCTTAKQQAAILEGALEKNTKLMDELDARVGNSQ